MNVFDEKRTELERQEFMMGVERGRLAVALDLQAVLAGIEGAKALIQSVMEEIRVKREEASSQSGAGR